MIKKYSTQISLAILIFVSFALRAYRLGEMPPGLTNDEVTYIYNAFSLAETGRDLYGHFLPWITNIMVPFLPVPMYLMAFVIKIFGLSIFSGRLVGALSGVSEVLLVYLIASKLFKSPLISFFSALALSVSPWHLQLTRSAYDPPIAVLFYLIATLIILHLDNRKNNLVKYLLFGLSLLLALFSYRAMNILLLPFCIVCLWFLTSILKINRKKLLGMLITMTLLSLFFIFIVLPQGKKFINEATSFETPLNFQKAAESVKHEISHADAPLWVSRIFINKATYSLRLFRENYLTAFSTDYLFTKGEANSIYSIWWRGMLYLIDLPLIFLGIIYLSKRKKGSLVFIILMLLIGALPASLSGPTGPSYVARAFFMIPFWAILIGGGITFFTELLRNKNKYVKIVLYGTLFILYSIQVGSYLYQYYARYSIYGAEAWFKSTLDLSIYIDNHKQQNVLLADASVFEFINYAFYTKIDPVTAQAVFNKGFKINRYKINNVKMFTDCIGKGDDNPKDILPLNTIYIVRNGCHTDFPADEFIRRYDGKFTETSEKIWKIYKSKDLTTTL